MGPKRIVKSRNEGIPYSHIFAIDKIYRTICTNRKSRVKTCFSNLKIRLKLKTYIFRQFKKNMVTVGGNQKESLHLETRQIYSQWRTKYICYSSKSYIGISHQRRQIGISPKDFFSVKKKLQTEFNTFSNLPQLLKSQTLLLYIERIQ